VRLRPRTPILLPASATLAVAIALVAAPVRSDPDAAGHRVTGSDPAPSPTEPRPTEPPVAHARADVEEAPTPVPPDPGYPPDRTFSPLPPSSVAHLRRLRALHPGLSDRAFMKVGDSTVESRAYLTCLAEELDLGEREALATTLSHFRSERARGADPFRRRSEASAVGWSARHVLSGRRSALVRELTAMRPRFALVSFGTNDVEDRAPHRFAHRMWRIVDRLLERGVIPVLSTAGGRADDRESDRWIPRYALITRGLAQGRGVPLLDMNREWERLPRRGLARDGVHPNTFVRRGRPRPCDFGEEGLTYGHNLRNLRTLEMLDRLRRTVVAGEPAPDPEPRALDGEGTADDPLRLPGLPWAQLGPLPVGVPERVHRIALARDETLWVGAFARHARFLELMLRRADGPGPPVRVRSHGVVELSAGRWDVVVKNVPRGEQEQYLLVLRTETLPPSPYP